VENLVEKVQNSNKITIDFHFSTHRGGGKVEKGTKFYSIAENGGCRKIKIFKFPLDKFYSKNE
jgi:hypothetical protein